MGSSYDFLEPIKGKIDYITIKPVIRDEELKLEITLQFKTKKPLQKRIIVDEVGMYIRYFKDILVEKGEKWGDWSGQNCKVGDVIHIHSKEEMEEMLRQIPEKVDFT